MTSRPGPLFGLLSGLVGFALFGTAAAQSPQERAIEAIRRDSASGADSAGAHPLPLAASWNAGTVATGFGPAYQVEQIRLGRYLLPWFILDAPPTGNAPDDYARPGDSLYYEPAIQFLAQHRLPLSFVSPQWEAVLWRIAPQYAKKIDADGKTLPLSPFDAAGPWYAAGLEWARHPTLRQLQKLYPDPPLVLFVSNNEQPKLSPGDLHANYDAHAGADAVARRRAIGDAWIERYRMLLRGFRDGLTSSVWRAHAVFIGYDAFVTPAMGRWGGWMAYSLYIPGRTEPWPYAWDGASVSYYVHDWAPDSDYTVWSPQIEAMNWVAELAQVRRTRPDFWFELSTWDGQQPGEPSDKRRFYTARGQELTPGRYGGMVQFGMWLLRPRVVREFRNPEDDRIRFGPYFDELLAAVARIHEDPQLRDFWQHGRLLENPTGGHPYEEALPGELAARARWFLLEASANTPRPWQLSTTLNVFSLALETGRKPNRDWLVYACSPLEEVIETEVAIPGGRPQHVRATREGAFTLVRERDAPVRSQ